MPSGVVVSVQQKLRRGQRLRTAFATFQSLNSQQAPASHHPLLISSCQPDVPELIRKIRRANVGQLGHTPDPHSVDENTGSEVAEPAHGLQLCMGQLSI